MRRSPAPGEVHEAVREKPRFGVAPEGVRIRRRAAVWTCRRSGPSGRRRQGQPLGHVEVDFAVRGDMAPEQGHETRVASVVGSAQAFAALVEGPEPPEEAEGFEMSQNDGFTRRGRRHQTPGPGRGRGAPNSGPRPRSGWRKLPERATAVLAADVDAGEMAGAAWADERTSISLRAESAAHAAAFRALQSSTGSSTGWSGTGGYSPLATITAPR